ncbi:MAG TPA: isochorismate synthase [Gemmatimonadaceae bacterium]|nr:isochorismate synthase [Gemmatimonadaceae bacterium]
MQQRKTRLDDLVEKAALTARNEGRSVLVSACERIAAVDPLALLESVDHALMPERMFWSEPRGALAFAAAGAVYMFEHSGADRFRETDRELKELLRDAIIDGVPDQRGVGPIVVGGFAFDDDGPRSEIWEGFGSSRLFLPTALVSSGNGESWLTLNLLVDMHGETSMSTRSLAQIADRLADAAAMSFDSVAESAGPMKFSGDDASYASLVSRAIPAIRNGYFDKVVLARSVDAESETDIDAFGVIRSLRAVHTGAFVFGIWNGDKVFAGASPELLVQHDRGEVRASSLAGTIERGRTPEDDTSLARQLEASAKDRAEHAAVRDALYAALTESCDNVVAPEIPVILSLSNVHHLHTPLRAKLREGKSLLDLVERLHPTPAVGGTPRDTALEFIRENEALDRGWYAAPVGWIGESSGEFAVALRSALIQGDHATLYAGCGIVMNSDPEMEVEESNLKLQAMKSALSASLVRARESVEVTTASDRSRK